uniref:Peroxisome assembly protein 12 n=1 Tax=Cacopsylla melanoneura TaxID=428564 RepID=A0A8D8PTI0_9HEMI
MISSSAITSQTSFHVKPSIFDLVAQDSMSELIQPSFRKIINYLSTKNPEKYGWMSKWVDECFLGFNVLVQRFCLVHCSASFSELMYKLRRVATSGDPRSNDRLPWRQEMLSLLCLTLVPHVRNKMEAHVETQRNTESETKIAKVLKLFLFLSSLSKLVHHIFYLTNRLETHSPLLKLCGVRLTYATDEYTHTNRFVSYLTTLVQVGALSVQLLSTWVNHDTDDVILSPGGGRGYIPAPPPGGLTTCAPVPNNVCPVCRKRFRIPTVLATSGYVFCFQCIAERVQTSPRCPLTGIPSSIEDLIQVYSHK